VSAATIIVLAKEPLPGRAKTRLTPPLPPRDAALVAAAALTDTLAVVEATQAENRLLAFEGNPAAWLLPGWLHSAQSTGDLDRRLIGAFAAVSCYGPALLIGMDTPQLRAAQLEQFEPRNFDACLGPARDGGYWAIGLADPVWAERVIAGVPMSSSETGAVQLQRLRAAGLRVQLLDELSDVDTFETACSVADGLAGRGPDGLADGCFAQAMRALRGVHA
jgi:hypothetical protein